jgi:hypothetical protein
MDNIIEEKNAPGRGKVKVLAGTYEKGEPEGVASGKWLNKLRDRQERIKYLKASMIL